VREKWKCIAVIIALLIGISACSYRIYRTSSPPAPLPDYTEVETLAARSDVVAVVIGTVVKDLGEEKGSEGQIYHYWEIAVEQYIGDEGANPIVVRITKAVQPVEGSPIPTKESRLAVGEHVLLFLSKPEEAISRWPNEFTMPGPLTGKYIVEDNSARAADSLTALSMPLDELIARIKAKRGHSDR